LTMRSFEASATNRQRVPGNRNLPGTAAQKTAVDGSKLPTVEARRLRPRRRFFYADRELDCQEAIAWLEVIVDCRRLYR
ncbi:hypothetical protein, partial [Mesorhizobium sp.]|uniref:hypothetical protein n=1 Tax=Mesorhizobium sp. TaxID=1871066 RepID=UPI00260028F0